jgi:putative transposase
MLVPQWPNDRWSLHRWQPHAHADRGRRLHARVPGSLISDISISGIRVARELDRLLVAHDKSKTIVRPSSATTAPS